MKIARGCAALSQLELIAKWCIRRHQAERDRSRRVFQRKLRTEFLESRQLMAADLLEHNVFDAEDVNDDGQCSPLDALLVIQELNSRASSRSTAGGAQGALAGNRVFPDVNNDGTRSPADALQVINRLNQRGMPPALDRSGNDPSRTKSVIPSTASMPRSYDGTGNNLANTELGSTDEQLLRVAPAEYGDGIASPAGSDLANPRTISNLLSEQQDDSVQSERDLSAYVYVWGQFIDHDISLTQSPTTGKESMNIAIPAGDEFFDPDGSGDAELTFTRSRFDSSTGTSASNPRQQVNQITAWIDGSMVYGSSKATADSLRTFTGGQMITSSGNLMPLSSTSGMFLAGDVRANENIELTALQTLWVREHNYWASKILAANPTATDEQVFQQARAIVIAEIQAITYNEWLPALLGRGAIDRYTGYKPTTNPTVANEFSTAAFRLGHSLLQDDIEFIGNDGKPVRDAIDLDEAFFNPAVISAEGIDGLLKYAASAHAAEIDTQVVDGVRNFLSDGSGGMLLDLAALNIQRGRDHGLADYNATRVAYGLAPVDSFDDITSDVEQQKALEAVYGDVDNIDLWIGGLAEDHVRGSSVGELVQTIVADQFERLRDGDRFWYENIFSGRDLIMLRNTRLSDILQRNTTITNVQQDVFYMRSAFSGSVFMAPAADPLRRGGAGMQAGVAGVTVELLNDTGEVVNTTVTDARGQYRFGSVAETGDYVIRVTAKSGTKVISASTLNVSVSRGDVSLHKLDFRLATA